MLILAISATTIVNAQRKQTVNSPVNVIKQLNATIDTYGQKDKQSYSVKRNPNTNLIESSEKIAHFSAKKNNIDQQLTLIREAFTKDEPLSYQFKHITPGIDDVFTISVLSENGVNNNTHLVRTEDREEMWFMCCKNPENPQLRDAYAITWKESKDVPSIVDGYVYMISSLRPDIYEEKLATSKKIFKIEGRVDAEIKDSLYNIYIADSYDALNRVGDDDYVACVPVINKRFEYSVELDKPKAGRLRCIFPDGSLCSAWIDVDMVPGETYRITVHNGYFDEDRDYENRVGRWSGKSLIAGHDNNDATVVHTPATAEPGNNPLGNLAAEQLLQLNQKAAVIKSNIDMIHELYEIIGKTMKESINQGGNGKPWDSFSPIFQQIYKQNDLLDKQIEDMLKTAFGFGVEKMDIVGLYKETLEIYTNQNKGFNELTARFGTLSKEASKVQKQVTKYTEKYMGKMSDAILQVK